MAHSCPLLLLQQGGERGVVWFTMFGAWLFLNKFSSLFLPWEHREIKWGWYLLRTAVWCLFMRMLSELLGKREHDFLDYSLAIYLVKNYYIVYELYDLLMYSSQIIQGGYNLVKYKWFHLLLSILVIQIGKKKKVCPSSSQSFANIFREFWSLKYLPLAKLFAKSELEYMMWTS